MLLPAITISLFLAYAGLILYYYTGWRSIPAPAATGPVPRITISVIVPARNEEARIGALLASVRRQDYPPELFELIVVDDHSTDSTARLVAEDGFARLVSLQETGLNAYKKKAIEAGIAAAKGELIVTTDADCVAPAGWLSALARCREDTGAMLIVAPVYMRHQHSLLTLFQSLDFLVLQGITGAVVHHRKMSLCNGANLAYDRAAFYAVNGFAGIDDIASGDDMLLMHKIATAFPGKTTYLRSENAIVVTDAEVTWKAFLRQRIRWASKAGHYQDKRIWPVLLLVYLFNCLFVALAIAGFFHPAWWIWLAGLLLAKTGVEWPFVSSVASFFGQQKLLRFFPFFQPLHMLYTIVAGLLGQSGPYEWKGRTVK